MKKLLFVVAVAGIMTSCKDKKDEKKAEETTTTTPTTVEPTTTTPTTTEPTTTEPATTAATGVPSFSDPEVQKFANDYAAFMANYKAGLKDPTKMADLTKNMQEWSTKSQQIGMKLATTPGEAKKWSEWIIALSKDMMPSMK